MKICLFLCFLISFVDIHNSKYIFIPLNKFVENFNKFGFMCKFYLMFIKFFKPNPILANYSNQEKEPRKQNT